MCWNVGIQVDKLKVCWFLLWNRIGVLKVCGKLRENPSTKVVQYKSDDQSFKGSVNDKMEVVKKTLGNILSRLLFDGKERLTVRLFHYLRNGHVLTRDEVARWQEYVIYVESAHYWIRRSIRGRPWNTLRLVSVTVKKILSSSLYLKLFSVQDRNINY